jgi:hypothetical protein
MTKDCNGADMIGKYWLGYLKLSLDLYVWTYCADKEKYSQILCDKPEIKNVY